MSKKMTAEEYKNNHTNFINLYNDNKSYRIMADYFNVNKSTIKEWVKKGKQLGILNDRILETQIKKSPKEKLKDKDEYNILQQQIKEQSRTELIIDSIKESIIPFEIYDNILYKSIENKKEEEEAVLVLSDVHVGKVTKTYNTEIFKKRLQKVNNGMLRIVELLRNGYKIDTLNILLTGDIVDGEGIYPTQSYHINQGVLNQVFQTGVPEFSNMFINLLKHFKKIKIYCTKGNHGRCLSEDTEILTEKGWKNYKDIKIGVLIPTINIEKNKVEWNPIQKFHIYENERKLLSVNHKSMDFAITEDHSMVVTKRYKIGGINKYYKYELFNITAKELFNSKGRFYIPNSCKSFNSEYSISDDWLKLLGWILTDGSISKYSNKRKKPHITISQSKLNFVNDIEKLLICLNLKYTKICKIEKEKEILGVKCKDILPQYKFHILKSKEKEYLLSLLSSKETFPKWFYMLSDRQISILLSTIIDGDGSYNNGYIIITGKENFLNQLQALLVTHNIACSIIKPNNRTPYLHILKNNYYSFDSRFKKEINNYNKLVWCITVNNNTIFTRRNGKVCILGNSGKFSEETSNWDLALYEACKATTQNYKNIEWNISYDWNNLFKIYDWKFLLVHGHQIKMYLNIPHYGVTNKGMRWQGSIDNFNYLVMGHFHSIQMCEWNNFEYLMNGTFSTDDEFSQEIIGLMGSAKQLFFGLHPRKGITWRYKINLLDNYKK